MRLQVSVSLVLPAVLAVTASAWVTRFHPDSGDACPAAVTADRERNVYVAGTAADNLLTLKYDSTGALLWSRSWDGPAGGSDSARGVCLESSGRVFVVGTATHPSGSAIVTLCYSPDGTLLWTGLHDTLTDGNDLGAAVVPDGMGGCITVGTVAAGTDRGLDFSVTRWDSAGARRWTQLYNGPGSSTDSATCAAGDDSGGVFVAGASAGFGDTLDYALLRFSHDGTRRWFDRQRADSAAIPRMLHRDPALGICLTGSARFPPPAGWDAYTVCYRPDLLRRWAQRFNGVGSTDDHGLAVDFGPDTSIYLAAGTYRGGTNLVAVGIRPDGSRLGTLSLPLAQDSVWLGAGIAAIPFIGFAVSTSRRGTGGDWDYLLAGCDSLFEVNWETGYSGPHGDDVFRAQCRVGPDAVCLSGTSVNESRGTDIVTITHRLAEPGIAESPPVGHRQARLAVTSPVRRQHAAFVTGCQGPAELLVCDIAGRVRIRQPLRAGQESARLPLSGLEPGAYVLHLASPLPATAARLIVLP